MGFFCSFCFFNETPKTLTETGESKQWPCSHLQQDGSRPRENDVLSPAGETSGRVSGCWWELLVTHKGSGGRQRRLSQTRVYLEN